jgi:hypothetical protein
MSLTVLCCLAALGLGVATALRTALNRERAARLDSLQRDCDHLTLENERVRFELAYRERALFRALLAREEPLVEVTQ